MSSRNITDFRDINVDSAEALNLKENSRGINQSEIEEDIVTELGEKRIKNINAELEKEKYERIFDEEFIKDFKNDLENNTIKFKQANMKVKEQKVEKEEIEDIIKIGIKNKKDKDQEKKEDISNIIKIYIDLYDLYHECNSKKLFSENFQDFVNNINKYENKDIMLERFDKFYQVLKINLLRKLGNNNFADIFFLNMKPKMLGFLIRFYMIRIYFAIKNNDKKIRKISIINKRNNIANEILYSIISKMINIYMNSKYQLKKLSKEKIQQTTISAKKNRVRTTKDKTYFIENESEYLQLILDYIYFEKVFCFKEENKQDHEYDNIYNKYVDYYDRLTAFTIDNYSYINEYKWKQSINEEHNRWNKYIRDEYINEGSKILYDILGKIIIKKEKKIKSITKRNFYEILFKLLKEIIVKKEKNENNNVNNKIIEDIIKLANGIIKIILADEENIFKSYLKHEKEEKKEEIFMPLIITIIKIIDRDILKKENNNSLNDLEFEYLNSLIILLECFGEYKNKYLLDYIFNKLDTKYKSVFDTLVDAYEKILKDLNEEKDNDKIKKNKLIIFNSLTNCINEYIELSCIDDKRKNNKIIFVKSNNISIISNNGEEIKKKDKEETEISRIINCKMKNIKIKNEIFTFKGKEDELTYDLFIIENHLQILIHLIKNLQMKNLEKIKKLDSLMVKMQIHYYNDKYYSYKYYFKETLIFMNTCFKSFLVLQKITLRCDKLSDRIIHDIKFDNKENDDNVIDNIFSDIRDDVNDLMSK